MKQGPRRLSGVVLDETVSFSLRELCYCCGLSAEQIIDMVEEGIIAPRGRHPREWRFSGPALYRVQRVQRLQRDLRINLPGAALILELLDELQELRRLQRRSMMG